MLYEMSKLLKDNLGNSVCFLVGSHQYGLDTENSDEDWTAVYFNPRDYLHPVRQSPVSSQSANGDYKIYSLDFFAGLLLKGNPNVVELCWENPHFPAETALSKRFPLNSVQSTITEFLQGARQHAITRQLLAAHAGHLQHIREEIGKKGITGKRLSHALRLGYSLVNLLDTGSVLPFRESAHREFCLEVKAENRDLKSSLEVFHNLDREVSLLYTERKGRFPENTRLEVYVNSFFEGLYTPTF